jgi:hypothetical protein
MRVQYLKGKLLHYWLVRAEGWTDSRVPFDARRAWETDPATCMAIMEREKIGGFFHNEELFENVWIAAVKLPPDEDRLAAGVPVDDEKLTMRGDTLLEAAMRVRVAQVFGEVVPE